jgi:type II secretory pathway pseudopilin PulG
MLGRRGDTTLTDPATILAGLMALVALALLGLLAAVIALSMRRSVTSGTAAEATGSAIRQAASDLVTALAAGQDPAEVDRAASRLAALLDLDPASLRSAARTRGKR